MLRYTLNFGMDFLKFLGLVHTSYNPEQNSALLDLLILHPHRFFFYYSSPIIDPSIGSVICGTLCNIVVFSKILSLQKNIPQYFSKKFIVLGQK